MRKILFLFLALSTLTVNAVDKQKVRLYADTSGLFGTDSFPKNKTVSGTGTWLSVKDGNFVVKESAQRDKDAWLDKNSVFELGFETTDSTNYKFYVPGTSTVVGGQYFELINKKTGNETGTPNAAKYINGKNGKGYLISSPAGGNLGLEPVTGFKLAGVGADGKVTLKNFKDFAFYADTLHNAPEIWTYQFKEGFEVGKIYQVREAPYFQIYDAQGQLLGDTANPINWGKNADNTLNPNDPQVYTWMDLKLSSDTGIYLFNKVVRFDSVGSFLEKDTVNGELGLTSQTSQTEEDLKIYLKNDDNRLSITTLKDKKWSNGLPSYFKYKGKDVWYWIDKTFGQIFERILANFVFKEDGGYTKAHSYFNDSIWGPKYVYKENDSWRPLWVQINTVLPSEEAIASEYVGQKWIADNYFNLSAAVQKVYGYDLSLSSDNDIELSATGPKIKFEYVKTLSASGDNVAVELFSIKTDTLYLTVLDKTNFVAVEAANTVSNTQVGWAGKVQDSDKQLWAVVHDYEHDVVTFIPYASRKQNATGVYSGDLSYNTLGKVKTLTGTEKVTDFSNTWYLSYKSKPGGKDKLVIAQPESGYEILWFELKSVIKPQPATTGYVTIKKAGKYYRADSTFVDTKENDIKTVFKLSVVDSIDNKPVANAYVVTSALSKKFDKQISYAGDTVLNFIEDGKNIVVDKTGSKVLDTVQYIPTKPELTLFNSLDKDSAQLTSTYLNSKQFIGVGEATDTVSYQASLTAKGVKVYIVQKTDTLDNLYKIPYYLFSTEIEGKKYYLNGDGNKLYWTTLTAVDEAKLLNTDTLKNYKFALPAFTSGVYLQTLDLQVVYASSAQERLLLEDISTDIYSALDLYLKGVDDILVWNFTVPAEWKEWATAEDLGFEEGEVEQAGKLLWKDEGVSVAVVGEVRYAVLNDPAALLLVKADTIPFSTFYIKEQGDYLVDGRKDDRATFIKRNTTSISESYAFKKEDVGYSVVSVASIEVDGGWRYLSARGTDLIFGKEGLVFDWEKALKYPAGIAKISTKNVVGVAGGILTDTNINVYSLDGRLIKKAVVTSKQVVKVLPGIYVVKTADDVVKVIVK